MKEFNMHEFIDIIITSYYAGIVYIFIGILIIRNTMRNPANNHSNPLQGNISGFGAGILAILGGVLLIYYKILGK